MTGTSRALSGGDLLQAIFYPVANENIAARTDFRRFSTSAPHLIARQIGAKPNPRSCLLRWACISILDPTKKKVRAMSQAHV